MNSRDYASMAWTLKVDAEDRLRKEESKVIAKGLKESGVSIEIIIHATRLSKEEIAEL